MIRRRPILCPPHADQPTPGERDLLDSATVDRLICAGLTEHMAALEEAGLELSWPVVRCMRDGKRSIIEVDSPYFFLNDHQQGDTKPTSAAVGVRPTVAGRRSDFGSGEQFIVAMRNPKGGAIDVILYSGGVLMLYRNSLSPKETPECLAALPTHPAEFPAFVESAVKAAADRLGDYLSRVEEPSVIRLNRDILNRHDLARHLSEAMVEADCSHFALDPEVEHVASDPGIAKRVNDEGRLQQLEYLLLTVGEVQTRAIVQRCIQAFATRAKGRRGDDASRNRPVFKARAG
ncbi:hypothetical protein [Endothiovibrio diazotrophicus]